MKKDSYFPGIAAIVVTIALLVSGVFVMAFLAGCATPYTVTIAEHPENNSTIAVTGAGRNTNNSIGGVKGDSIDPSGEISGRARSKCK